MSWPPELTELKTDLDVRDSDTRNDSRLQLDLDAATAFVERVHAGAYSFGDQLSTLPEVPADVRLGTLRLAGRWGTRRRSPDGLVTAGPDLGNSRVPAIDADIARLLRIDRFRSSVIA
jgi:hypothetical protein